DALRARWAKGNGGEALEPPNNASARQVGHVEDKQWIAVNHIVPNIFADHVYSVWSVFNGLSTKVRLAVSRDRGQSFDKAVTISAPGEVGSAGTFAYDATGAARHLYGSVGAFPPDGQTPQTFV